MLDQSSYKQASEMITEVLSLLEQGNLPAEQKEEAEDFLQEVKEKTDENKKPGKGIIKTAIEKLTNIYQVVDKSPKPDKLGLYNLQRSK